MCKTKAGYLKIGTSRSEDSDSGENVNLKVKWWSFSVDRDYSNSLTFPNIGDFSGSSIPEIIQVQKDWKDRKICPICVPTKRTWNWAISLCCRVVTAKKCTNKVCCTCRVVVLLIICSYCFFDVPVAVAFVASKGPLWYIQRVKKKKKRKKIKVKEKKERNLKERKGKKIEMLRFTFSVWEVPRSLKFFSPPPPPPPPAPKLLPRKTQCTPIWWVLQVNGWGTCLSEKVSFNMRAKLFCMCLIVVSDLQA